jgi:hypothetical protein
MPSFYQIAPNRSITQGKLLGITASAYAKRALMKIPLLDDWEKEWGDSQRSVQPKLLPADFRLPLAAIAQSNSH